MWLGTKKLPSLATIYELTNRRIEKLSKILNIIVGQILPTLVIWPKFVTCFVVYITTDLDSGAFELPILRW